MGVPGKGAQSVEEGVGYVGLALASGHHPDTALLGAAPEPHPQVGSTALEAKSQDEEAREEKSGRTCHTAALVFVLLFPVFTAPPP